MIAHVAAGDRVEVELSRVGRWTGRVEAVAEDRVAVAVVARLPRVPAALSGTPARMRFASARGVMSVPAVVLSADRSGLLDLTTTGEVVVDQRREHVRVSALLPGVVAPRTRAFGPLHTYTIDVSGGGLLVAGAGPVEVGDAVAVTIKLPNAEPLLTGAHVSRRRGDGHVALSFEGIDEQDREQLVRYVFERQRLERRAGSRP